jgi:hypothetical protein
MPIYSFDGLLKGFFYRCSHFIITPLFSPVHVLRTLNYCNLLLSSSTAKIFSLQIGSAMRSIMWAVPVALAFAQHLDVSFTDDLLLGSHESTRTMQSMEMSNLRANKPKVILCDDSERECILFPLNNDPDCHDIATFFTGHIKTIEFNRELSGCHFHPLQDCGRSYNYSLGKELVTIYGTGLERGMVFNLDGPESLNPGGLSAQAFKSVDCFGPNKS